MLFLKENVIVTGSGDKTIRIWDLKNPSVYSNFEIDFST